MARRKIRFSLSLPRVLLLAGSALFLGALLYEAVQFPWPVVFGGDQSDAALPDPSSLVLSQADSGAAVTDAPGPGQTAAPESPPEDTVLPGAEDKSASAVPVYVQLGVFKIPKLRVSVHLLEGTGRQLRYGVGHVTGTAAVGQPGNCAVAGHRPYPFRYLDQLASGDRIILKADNAAYTYTVYESFTVLPNETWVLRPVEGESYVLTLITCTPYLISSHRLIVRARLTDVNGKTPEQYYGTAEPSPSPSGGGFIPLNPPEPSASGEQAALSPAAPETSPPEPTVS